MAIPHLAPITLGTGTVGIYSGTGSPEGVVTAGIGSIYLRTDGGAGTSVYNKESGTGNTGWVADSASGSGIPATTIDAKGDLLAGTANDTVARLAVGSNRQLLAADSTQTTGLKWVNATELNLKDYGALGDNSTDDSTAITNWLAALGTVATASGAAVGYVPAGTYINGVTQTIPSNVIFRGEGRYASVFKVKANTFALDTVFFQATGAVHVTFVDLGFDGVGETGRAQKCISTHQYPNDAYLTVMRCRFVGWRKSSIVGFNLTNGGTGLGNSPAGQGVAPNGSGTTTTGSTTTVINDSTKTWTVNQWAGLSMFISGQLRTVTSNTATAVTLSVALSGAPTNGTQYYLGTTNLGMAIEAWTASYIIVDDCEFEDCTIPVYIDDPLGPIRVRRNRMIATTSARMADGIYIRASTSLVVDAEVSGNFIKLADYDPSFTPYEVEGHGINLYNVHGVRVFDNAGVDNFIDLVHVGDGAFATVSRNMSSGGKNGIFVETKIGESDTTIGAAGVTGTATGGTSTTIVDTTKNFSTLGVRAGWFVRFRTAGGIIQTKQVYLVTTTTNPNDTLQVFPSWDYSLVPASTNTYSVYSVRTNIIAENTCRGHWGRGIAISYSASCEVIDNVVFGCGAEGIYCDSDNVRLTGNTVYNNHQDSGYTSSWWGGAKVGIGIQTGKNCTLTNNTCYDNQGTKTQQYGIGVEDRNHYIAQNKLDGNSLGSIWAPDPSTTLIYDVALRYTSVASDTRGASSTAENAFTQSFTIPANSLRKGSSLRLEAWGVLSNISTPNLTIKVKIGSTIILTTGTNAMPGASTNRGWCLRGLLTMRLAGSSGTVRGQGQWIFGTAANAGAIWDMENTADSSAINFTTDQIVTITQQWGTSNAGNTVTLDNFIVEIFG